MGTGIQDYAPIVFGGSTAVLVANTPTTIPNFLDTANSYRTPMLIDEIWACTQDPGVLMDLRIGSTLLTQGYQPLFLWGQRQGMWTNSPYNFSWRFSRPMLVGAGAKIFPMFLSVAAQTASVVTLSIRGRALPASYQLPAVSHVPYLTAWQAQWSGAGQARSAAPYLTNPALSEPLHCQRMVGATWGAASPVLYDSPPSHDVDVQLFHSNGFGIAKDWTPFAHLFSFLDRSLNAPFTLAPRESVYARLRYGEPTDYIPMQAHIGIQGYRAVPVSEVL